jgi:aryl-alcohol dehydrogenase-like predicted oxidoreductase
VDFLDTADQRMPCKHILDSIEASLRRLKTDCVELYQLHGYDPAAPLDEALEAPDTVVRHDKARYVGVSNWPAHRIARAIGRTEVKTLMPDPVGAAPLQSAVPHLRAGYAAALRGGGRRRHLTHNPLAGRLFTGKHPGSDAPPNDGRFHPRARSAQFKGKAPPALLAEVQNNIRAFIGP